MRKGWESWTPGCGWGATATSPLLEAEGQFWQDVRDGLVTHRAYPDESVTLRCENGPWVGSSFRLYPPETELVLGPITYVLSPPTEGKVVKGSVSPKKAWHLLVKGAS